MQLLYEEGSDGGKGSFAHQAAVNPMIKGGNIRAILIISNAFKAVVK